MSLYKSKGDCAPDEFLSMDSDRDLQRYEEKLRRRYSEQVTVMFGFIWLALYLSSFVITIAYRR